LEDVCFKAIINESGKPQDGTKGGMVRKQLSLPVFCMYYGNESWQFLSCCLKSSR